MYPRRARMKNWGQTPLTHPEKVPLDTLVSLILNVLERDRIDSARSVAPLRQAEDAVVVDNSDLTVEEQFNFLVSLARTRMEEDA